MDTKIETLVNARSTAAETYKKQLAAYMRANEDENEYEAHRQDEGEEVTSSRVEPKNAEPRHTKAPATEIAQKHGNTPAGIRQGMCTTSREKRK